jgi:hypothetical protein
VATQKSLKTNGIVLADGMHISQRRLEERVVIVILLLLGILIFMGVSLISSIDLPKSRRP